MAAAKKIYNSETKGKHKNTQKSPNYQNQTFLQKRLKPPPEAPTHPQPRLHLRSKRLLAPKQQKVRAGHQAAIPRPPSLHPLRHAPEHRNRSKDRLRHKKATNLRLSLQRDLSGYFSHQSPFRPGNPQRRVDEHLLQPRRLPSLQRAQIRPDL